jgi:predicted ATPase
MAGFTLRDSPDFDEWQFFEREALRDELALALERLMRWHTSQGEYDHAIAHTRRWLALDPLHEPVHRHLMELYAQAGRRAAVERQYQECVQILEAGLGAPPADATTALYEQLQTRPKESDDRLFPAALPRHNLPAQATPFIGREAELADIERLLRDPTCRMLTLIGPGGSGKTRLALEAAKARLDAHEHGVFFISLAPLEDVSAIVPAVADVLGFRFYSGGTPQEQLLSYLRQKNLLMILDNYEHLLEGVRLVIDIIKMAPEVKILATSRARLNVGGEHRFHVGGMDYPCEEAPGAPSVLRQTQDVLQYSAVRLFLQGARRAEPSFELTNENLSGVVQICRLVEGMPLAIRLAASWVEMLSPAEIMAEIGGSLDLLETERQDVPERQRSMRAAFDHSWNLLAERQREIFQTLSVFRGPFTRQAAQQVAGATLRELRILVEKSLLYPVAEGVYELHELLRQYAAEKLDEAPGAREAARDRHCAHYAAALESWAADLKGPRSHIVPGEIDVEIENVRAAWKWAVERKHTAYLGRAVEGLCLYYDARRRPHETDAACQLAVERLASEWFGDESEWRCPSGISTDHAEELLVLARMAAWQSLFTWHARVPNYPYEHRRKQSLALLEDLEAAGLDVRREKAMLLFREGDKEKSLALFRAVGDDWVTAKMLHTWSLEWGEYAGAFDQWMRLEDESLALFQEVGDQAAVAWVLTMSGWQAYIYSEYADAKQRWERSLPLHRSLNDAWGEGVAVHSLGCAAWISGDFGRAEQLLEEALAIQNPLGDQRGLADSLHQLANVVLYQGEFEKAESLARQSIAISRAIGHRNTIGSGCERLGMALVALGRYAEACSALEEGAAIFSELNWVSASTFQRIWLGRAYLHLGQYDQARTLGRTCLDSARKAGPWREIGLSLLLLGDAALTEGASREAHDILGESLDTLQEIGYRPELGPVLAGLGVAACRLGDLLRARKHCHEALRICTEMVAVFPLLCVLPAAALLLAEQGKSERAVEVYTLASRYPYVANSRWFEDVVGKHITAAAADLPSGVVSAAQERGRALDWWETAEALLNELGW